MIHIDTIFWVAGATLSYWIIVEVKVRINLSHLLLFVKTPERLKAVQIKFLIIQVKKFIEGNNVKKNVAWYTEKIEILSLTAIHLEFFFVINGTFWYLISLIIKLGRWNNVISKSMEHDVMLVNLVVRFYPIVFICIAGWSSLVARVAHNHKVGSSNLPPATEEPK